MKMTMRICITSWVVLGGLFDVAPTLVVAATRHADYGIQSATRDKTGTSACQKYTSGSQLQARKQLTNLVYMEAEGMGFEPTTPCGAPDFESGRWPVRLPSGQLRIYSPRPVGATAVCRLPVPLSRSSFEIKFRDQVSRSIQAARATGIRALSGGHLVQGQSAGPGASYCRPNRQARQRRHWRHTPTGHRPDQSAQAVRGVPIGCRA